MTLLSPVQIEALRRSYGKRGWGHFLDMGLGKTLLALDEFRRAVKANVATRLVVICPNNFKSGWVEEIEKHRYVYDVHVLEADSMKKARAFVAARHEAPPILIINYEAIRLGKVLDLIEDYANGANVMLVVDESIAVKNPTSKRTRAILAIAPLFTLIRCLTGKPQSQGPQDLWSQLRLCGLDDGRNFYAFRNRFCRMGGFMGREIIGAINTDELHRILDQHSFIATKEDWLEGLTEKVSTTRRYELGEVLGRHYAEMRDQYMTWLREHSETVTVEIAITKYIKLAQIQAGFIIREQEGSPGEHGWAESLVMDADNPRLNLLLDILKETSGKVAICFKHRFVGGQLYKLLARRQMAPTMLIGGMKGDEISFAKRLFNEDPKCRAILLQIQASKFGHTLIGDQEGDISNACSTMIFYENSYSLDDRSQIEDRIHRRGQKSACLYVDLVGSELDGEIIAALQRKEGMYQAVMGRGIRGTAGRSIPPDHGASATGD